VNPRRTVDEQCGHESGQAEPCFTEELEKEQIGDYRADDRQNQIEIFHASLLVELEAQSEQIRRVRRVRRQTR
jgi:hypothetical protein